MSRHARLAVLATTALAACSFESVRDHFWSTSTAYVPHAAAVSADGLLFVAQDDGAGGPTIDVHRSGRRIRSFSLGDVHEVIALSTDPTTGWPVVLGLADGDAITLTPIDAYGASGAAETVDLSQGIHRVHEVCDFAVDVRGNYHIAARREYRRRPGSHRTDVLEWRKGGRHAYIGFMLDTSRDGPTGCVSVSHDASIDRTWAVRDDGWFMVALDQHLNHDGYVVLDDTLPATDIAAEGGLVALARDWGSQQVLELYHDGVRFDVTGVDGTTALAADRTGSVPGDCAADGGWLWRVHQDDTPWNLHAHAVCE